MASSFSVKLKPQSSLLSESLYQLEAIFGRCSVHGAGFGGEDIHFPFPNDKASELKINRSGRRLTVSVSRFANDTWTDLHLKDIPSPLRERLVGLLREHTEGPIPDELTRDRRTDNAER